MYIICESCKGNGCYFAGRDYYSLDYIYEECNYCNGYGYLPLIGWAVLTSTYGSDVNTYQRNIAYWNDRVTEIISDDSV